MRRTLIALTIALILGPAIDGSAANTQPRQLFEKAQSLAERQETREAYKAYREVINVAPRKYPTALYVASSLALELGKCGEAVLLFRGYSKLSEQMDSMESPTGLTKCKRNVEQGQLKVRVKPKRRVEVFVDGIFVARTRKRPVLQIPAGPRTVRVEAEGFESAQSEVAVEHDDDISVEFQLQEADNSGLLKLDVSKSGATVRMTPRDLANKDTPIRPIVRESPLRGPIELPPGAYFLEIERAGFKRWIRNLNIGARQKKQLDVQLQEKRASIPFR